MDILQVILTSILSLVALFLLAKLMGIRQISQMSMFDYINGITLGDHLWPGRRADQLGHLQIPVPAQAVQQQPADFI